MSQQNKVIELKVDIIAPDSPNHYLIEGEGVQAVVSITQDMASAIYRMVEAVINAGGAFMMSDPVEGVVQWPVHELTEMLGIELDERDFTFACINVHKTTFSFSIRNSALGLIETVDIDVLELSRHFPIVVPWLGVRPVWREDALDWFRDMITAGTEDLEAEADVAKAVIETLLKSAPTTLVVAAMTEWAQRVEKNEDRVFDFVHAIPPETEGELSLLERSAQILTVLP